MKTLKTILTVLILATLATLTVSCGGGGGAPEVGDNPPPPITPTPPPTPTGGGTGGTGYGYATDPIDIPAGNGYVDSEDGETGPSDGDLDDDGLADELDKDADGDGFYADADDCDDLDANTNPSVIDRPDYPNYKDTNCDGVDGDSDTAVWVSTDGDDNNPGTIDEPVRKIQTALAIAADESDNIRDIYVVGGTYEEDAGLVNGVGIYGGYGPLTQDNIRTRDIDFFGTDVAAQEFSFTVGLTTTGIESVIEGISFYGADNNNGLTIVDSSPTIRYSKIYSTSSGGNSIALDIISLMENARVQPLIYDCLIENRTTVITAKNSVSVLIRSIGENTTVSPTLVNNDIRGSYADEYSFGVNVYTLTENSQAHVYLSKNTIDVGGAGVFSCGVSLGYDAINEPSRGFTSANISQNKIFAGGYSAIAMGIFLSNGKEVSYITNNFIKGGVESHMNSGGVYVFNTATDIYNNTILAGTAQGTATAISLDFLATAKIENNILFGAGESSTGILEVWDNATVSALRNNLFHTELGTKYFDFAEGKLNSMNKINSLTDVGLVGDNIEGDPNFVDYAGGDYHIASDSPAIDAGLNLDEMGVDIDNETRPNGEIYDIGADEYYQTSDGQQ